MSVTTDPSLLFFDLLAQYGFPIFMCLLIYLDLRKKIECVCQNLDKLINKLIDK